MAIHESTLNPDNRNHLTRRAALCSTAAAATMALPAGVAMAATAGETPSSGVLENFVEHWKANPELPRRFAGIDANLAKLGAGYVKWQALRDRSMEL